MKHRLCLVLQTFLTFCTVCLSQPKGSSAKPSVSDELVAYGFPAGLLPETVVDYDLQTNGNFNVYLQEVCAATLRKTYHVTYGSTISGHLEYGAISGLSGISVKAFFFNLAITGIYVSGNDLLFEVGFVSAKFPVTNFDESPICQSDFSMFSPGVTS
ncbi:hypothetical protein O6H91_08G114600 [Diphasiastrum complanatum]|uniref:Uncharacterized protein n=1 Tax=Diphasiastrum complanatum TaxID=34168 RepID=A0ACC2D1J0_DIPCM|nr:hypothetical protein O6H91_08G114600 [Diphasiastrum complanatum]